MRHVSSAIMIAAICGCSNEGQVTQPRQERVATAGEVRYEVVKLPSLGGTQSRGMAINRQGWVAGWSDQANGTRRAVLWKNGSITNLQTLGGPSSAVPWPGLGRPGKLRAPAPGYGERLGPGERAMLDQGLSCSIVVSPEMVQQCLEEFIRTLGSKS